MFVQRIVVFTAALFFVGGLAVIPQNINLTIAFIVASIILGLVSIYLNHKTKKRRQERIDQLGKYTRTGEKLASNSPKTQDEYTDWEICYTEWHEDVYSWLHNISAADATAFVASGDKASIQSTGVGKHYQAYANTLRTRLENLRGISSRYS